jgi:hypothetical protein
MTIIYEKKEIHLDNPSLHELCNMIYDIRLDSSLDDFKIIIDGTDKETDS